MSEPRTQAAVLLALGAMALRLGLTDAGLAYLKPVMQPLLALAGLVVVAFGAAALWQALRPGDADPEPIDHAELHGVEPADPHAGHDHAHGMGAAWLLVAPILALLLIAPPPLGSFAADRQGDRPLETAQTEYEPLPEPRDGAVDLDLSEFTFRALYDPDESLADERVRLTGFVTADEDRGEGAYRLTRFVITCCAADATAVQVRVVGDAGRPNDQWIELEGRWQPLDGHTSGETSDELPVVEADAVQPIEQPTEPYEY